MDIVGLPHTEWLRELTPLLEEAGEPPYRARQLLSWTFHRDAASFDAMSDLPRRLRDMLGERLVLHPLEVDVEKRSRDGTRKFLWKRRHGDPIESVSIPDGKRDTFCISSQAGCAVACTFCATGFGGFSGQLTAAEIVDQVLGMRRLTGRPPTNVVFMGMGEPLLNLDAVLRSIDVLCHPKQLGLGARRITVSTVGIPQRIVALGRAQPQVKLAISLHAARDELRDEIIPLNRRYPLSELLDAVREHHEITGKLVTFEYIVLPGVNDSDRDVRELARLLVGIPSRINLIGFNPFPSAPYERPEVRRLTAFRAALEERYPGPVTIRRSRGEDIQGACGQLSLAAGRAGGAAKR